ncbi:Feline leukemia virus subgroup C receptor-related protein 2 [Gryllus bimaculatus]|nr:Feline leukemia virus subgroup C receptor-related protein 2 [Gryllus bimaculatus]
MGTCAGASLKAFAAEPWLWSLAFAGQAITAMSQTCLLGVPARLAAVWFPSTELASATAVGVFGNQVRGPFVLPHWQLNMYVTEMIRHVPGHCCGVPGAADGGAPPDVRGRYLSVPLHCLCVTRWCCVVGAAGHRRGVPGAAVPGAQRDERGRHAAAAAPPVRQHRRRHRDAAAARHPPGVRRLMTHRNFLLLLVAYALNVGSFYAVSTLLGQAVAARVNDSAEHAGVLGLVMVVAGMLGSVICGVILDRTRRYKEVTLAVYVMSLVGLILYAGALASRSLGYLYFASISLGFFMTGYLPLGFELAAELTYPEPEGTSSGLLNAGAQLGGLASTPAYAAPAGQRAATFVAPTPAVAAALRAGMGRVPCRPVHLPNTCFHSRARVRATPRLLDALDVAHVDD